jgi:hypothetical protein
VLLRWQRAPLPQGAPKVVGGGDAWLEPVISARRYGWPPLGRYLSVRRDFRPGLLTSWFSVASPRPAGVYFFPPSQGLKTMAWHLQCWLQYSATDPRGCISERFSAPGATALVPRHRKSACKSSLRRQVSVVYGGGYLHVICGGGYMPASRHSEGRSVLRPPHDFLQRKKIHVKNLPSSRHSKGRSCSPTDQ